MRLILGELDQEWKLRAACRGHPRPDIFYPPPARADADIKRSHSERRRRIVVAEAKSLCRRCPVRAKFEDTRFGIPPGGTGECLAFADALGDYHGIWGGLTARERGRPRDER
ncbi:WhiB-like transcriptional regulator [Mycobacterium phage Weirdo19]|uniref:WhiB-like transcriptional regulator n=1 Tax=Mycobacterium phage Weirdo19 TaxID=2601610 RepID=A0A6M2YST7_9CAUD|nr:WhiB-like transcriptional regulator [Mycobacterium phage Weirdo19]QEA10835.1 WhiB-like transcriptional regulator [Mycobacterium phage Weirdo19]